MNYFGKRAYVPRDSHTHQDNVICLQSFRERRKKLRYQMQTEFTPTKGATSHRLNQEKNSSQPSNKPESASDDMLRSIMLKNKKGKHKIIQDRRRQNFQIMKSYNLKK